MKKITKPVGFHLAPHFTYGELTRSQTATRHGIDNRPTERELENMIALCEHVLEPVRDIYSLPLIVTSGLRVLELNRMIGSSDTSQHPKGEAADFHIIGNVKLHDLWRSIVLNNNIPFDQCIFEFNEWIHISHVRDGKQRGKITISRKNSKGKTYYRHYTQEQIHNFDYDWE